MAYNDYSPCCICNAPAARYYDGEPLCKNHAPGAMPAPARITNPAAKETAAHALTLKSIGADQWDIIADGKAIGYIAKQTGRRALEAIPDGKGSIIKGAKGESKEAILARAAAEWVF